MYSEFEPLILLVIHLPHLKLEIITVILRSDDFIGGHFRSLLLLPSDPSKNCVTTIGSAVGRTGYVTNVILESHLRRIVKLQC